MGINLKRKVLSYSKGVSLALAFAIALVSAGSLILVRGFMEIAIAFTFCVTFAGSYLLIQTAIQRFFYNEIKKIRKSVEKLKKGDFISVAAPAQNSGNPFSAIHDEIQEYAAVKQEEIDKLKKLETFRREFLADVSHELKTPLFAAQGFVLTLLDGAAKDESVREKFLRKAAKSLGGMEMIIEDLFTISQMESGQIRMNFVTFDICQVAREALEQFEAKASKRNISLKLHDDSGEMMVYGDPKRIGQALTNLFSNAIKYNKDGGNVEAYFTEKKKTLAISVRDNGIGIPTQDIGRIFERFYRVDKSRSKDKGGSGLGLAIVKHILEAHSSRISVTSVVGEGSTFTFTLKKAKTDKKEKEVLD